jgi:hypothetical protein
MSAVREKLRRCCKSSHTHVTQARTCGTCYPLPRLCPTSQSLRPCAARRAHSLRHTATKRREVASFLNCHVVQGSLVCVGRTRQHVPLPQPAAHPSWVSLRPSPCAHSFRLGRTTACSPASGHSCCRLMPRSTSRRNRGQYCQPLQVCVSLARSRAQMRHVVCVVGAGVIRCGRG